MVQGLTKTLVLSSSHINGAKDADKLEDNLSSLDGVREVNANPDEHKVEITFDPTVLSELALQSEVERLGYKIDSVSERSQLPL